MATLDVKIRVGDNLYEVFFWLNDAARKRVIIADNLQEAYELLFKNYKSASDITIKEIGKAHGVLSRDFS